MPTRIHALLLALAPGLWIGPEGDAEVFLTKEEALALAFPECTVERTTWVLTEAQQEVADELAGFEVEKKPFFAYVARSKGEKGALVGTAWFDVHQVRTKKETVMVVVTPGQRVKRIELLAFAEPAEYIPRPKWYAQFVGKELDDELRLQRGIKGVTGATLTARATTQAVRRVLAVHAAVYPKPPVPEEDRPRGVVRGGE